MPVWGLVFKTSERRSASLVGSTPTGFRHTVWMTVRRRELIRLAGAAPLAAASSTLPVPSEFRLASGVTELNNARWHPLSTGARRAVETYLDFKQQSPLDGTRSQPDIKATFARLINARPSEISFVPSTTAGENLLAIALNLAAGGGNVVTDALHFEGSLYLYQSLAKQGLDLRVAKPRNWRIQMEDLDRLIDRKTKLVALSLVSANTGFVHDLKAVCDLAHSRGALVYADIVQAAGAIPIDVKASGVDFCATASYKWLMGDMGLGFLYAREEHLDRVLRRPQFGYRQLKGWHTHIFPYDAPNASPLTWEQNTGAAAHFEVGTISNTTAAALGYSLSWIEQLGVANIQKHTQSLITRLKQELPRMGHECLTPDDSHSPIATFVIKDEAAAQQRLTAARVSVRLHDHLMRVSPSIYNTQQDIDRLLEALKPRG